MDELWWGGWDPVVRLLVVGTLGYVWLVGVLRVTGPRNLAKMTPFDFVLTVTLGSAYGRVLTATEVPLVVALLALTLLVALQWAFAALRRRSSGFRRLVDTGPVLLFHDGEFVEPAMRRHRFLESDVHSAARENGLGSLDDVAAVVLQADGSFAVIQRSSMGDASAVAPYMSPRSG
ncbi:hypothetical protein CLV92_102149 [Kineococcus xinjiangensis]|uniref:DUF421 domain-containing protein n=1 Tax=Kineococcus xinjiangensis TaxID=512762 RepID=A0A2S6IUW2_9ACTN|nr:YetF domain-containing protein [Kineococcus xinjiangensis]PPK97998.1 hypothetical protein CLV92_102149 [Kineococcus xinjiangensis]